MPRIVDHAQRRREVARAVLRLIASDGVEAVTLAAVSVESGWSRGVLTHYFENKEALVEAALREGMRTLSANLADAVSEPDSRLALRLVLEEILSLDARRLAFTRVYVSFMAQAFVSDRLQAYFDRNHAAWRGLIAEVIERGRVEGDIPLGPDAEGLASALAALTEGLRMRALCDRTLSAAAQSKELQTWVDALLGSES